MTTPDPVAPLSGAPTMVATAADCEAYAAAYRKAVSAGTLSPLRWAELYATLAHVLSRLEREQGAAGGGRGGTWSPHPTIAGAMRYSGDFAGLPAENVDRVLGSPELSRHERPAPTPPADKAGPAPGYEVVHIAHERSWMWRRVGNFVLGHATTEALAIAATWEHAKAARGGGVMGDFVSKVIGAAVLAAFVFSIVGLVGSIRCGKRCERAGYGRYSFSVDYECWCGGPKTEPIEWRPAP